MTPQIIESFSIIGIKIRTTNENNEAENDIPALWGKFLGEGIMQKIPNKVEDTVYLLYTDYETDYTGVYTTIIGSKVSSLDNVPEGMVGKTIEAGNYVKFTAKGNIMEGVVQEKWKEIWNTNLDRAYTCDFDVYGDKAKNVEDGEVDIFVSVI
jgi:predicted transcriptional regulator YdeE